MRYRLPRGLGQARRAGWFAIKWRTAYPARPRRVPELLTIDSGAFPVVPEAFRVLPDAFPWLPDAFPWLRDAFPWLPDALPRFPDALPEFPDALPEFPEACLDTRGRVPDVPARIPVVPCPVNVTLSDEPLLPSHGETLREDLGKSGLHYFRLRLLNRIVQPKQVDAPLGRVGNRIRGA